MRDGIETEAELQRRVQKAEITTITITELKCIYGKEWENGVGRLARQARARFVVYPHDPQRVVFLHK